MMICLISLQIAKLQDDNKALDRLTKSKEAALLEAERTVQVALAKASMVDDLQNKNQELMKQIEICQVLLSCSFFFLFGAIELGILICLPSLYIHPCVLLVYRKKIKFWTRCIGRRLQRLKSLPRL